MNIGSPRKKRSLLSITFILSDIISKLITNKKDSLLFLIKMQNIRKEDELKSPLFHFNFVRYSLKTNNQQKEFTAFSDQDAK